MEPLRIEVRNLTVPADIRIIKKYHKNSAAFYEKKKPVINRSFDIYLLTDGTSYLHPDYCYDDVIVKMFPESRNNTYHGHNILAMVANILEIDWSSFLSNVKSYNPSSYVSTRLNPNTDYNPHHKIDVTVNAISILESLDKLMSVHKDFLDDTEIELIPRRVAKNRKVDGHPFASLPQSKMALQSAEKFLIVALLINSRQEALKDLSLLMDDFSININEEITSDIIQKEISRLRSQRSLEETYYLLKRHICNIILDYLNKELKWAKSKTKLTTKQGAYIYTVLLLFNLITAEELKGHTCPRDKAKYISSFFKEKDKRKISEVNVKAILNEKDLELMPPNYLKRLAKRQK